MGDTTALQKAELDARRQALRARVSRFRDRLSEDRDALADEAKQLTGPDSKLSEHTGALVAGSAAVGFLAGVAPRPRMPTPDVGSPVKKVAGKGASTGASFFMAEAGVVAKDFLDGLFDRRNGDEEAHGDDALAAG